jgi:hypothetical protein
MIHRQIKMCEWSEHVLYRRTDHMTSFEYNSSRMIIIFAIVLSLIHGFRILSIMNNHISWQIIINSLKTFLEYQSVILLKQRVNVLELITIEEKLKAIALFKFSKNLTALKKYFELIHYLKNKIYFFAKVAKFLQKLKTKLFKNSSIEVRRKEFINRTKIMLINKKMISFLFLQKDLIKITLLIHFDKIKWLWISLDEFKKFDFEVIVFHVTKKFFKEIWSTKDDIQSIMFLSRLLTSVERN